MFIDMHHHLIYGVDDGARDFSGTEKMIVDAVNNQVDTIITTPHMTPGQEPFPYEEYQAHLEEIRQWLEKEKIGIFMGSWHEPNLEAARAVMRAAGKCGGAKLYLMGSQCRYFEDKELPENVALMGLVSEAEKQRVFSMADFALNPIISGSGTNLKMFDYMAAGIPVITTRFGMRGIGREDVVILAENEELAEAIRAFDLPACAERVEKARKYVEDVFDWKVIAESVLRRLKEPGTNQNRK